MVFLRNPVPDTTAIVADNLARVRQQILDAANAAGRNADEIQLVGVTKYVGPNLAAALFDAGCQNLGESRPQQLWDKASELGDRPVHWHMIGHLQRNKIRRTLAYSSLIHSGDSVRLIEAVGRIAEELAIEQVPLLIEVNISGDDAKHGFAPEKVEAALDEISTFSRVQIRGLMGMASREGDRETASSDFARLRALRERLASVCPDSISLAELSMGMSGDFREAICEGSTIVRIGSALYEGVTADERNP